MRLLFERSTIMNIRLNRKRFAKFVLMIAILAIGAFFENGNITGALVLAMLI